MDMPSRTLPHDSQALPGTWADFQPGDSLFASPGEVLHGRGCLLRAQPRQQIPACAAGLLAEATARIEAAPRSSSAADPSAPVLLGLLPYNPDGPASAQLMIPQVLRRMSPPQDLPAPSLPAIVHSHEHPAGALYEQGVSDALARLAGDPALRKLVLARTLQLALSQPVDLSRMLARLWQRNPDGYTYALPLSEAGTDYFAGASPELLVQRRGRHVLVHPLAGTAARHPDTDTDQRQAQTLLQSPKDRLEHALVIEAIETVLRPLCRTLDIPARPSLTSTPRLWHLGTPIRGELSDPAIQVLDLAIALHPTPAVCGLPTAQARCAIADIEPFERGYFAGATGWCNAQGDGVWSVAIRCAHIAGRHLTLTAGAGIVPGSIPAQERIETGNKLRTILDALGLESAP